MAVTAMMRAVKTAIGLILVPDTALDAEAIDRLKKGTVLKVEIKVPRNPKFHRKGFALISVIFDCMDERTKEEMGIYTPEMLRKRILLDLGRFTLFIVGPDSTIPEGTCVYEVDSMAFDKMDDDEFATLYDQIMMIAVSKYANGQNEESLNAMVDEVLKFGQR